MQIVTKHIKNIAGAPIGNALITVTDVLRTPVVRNGNIIQRYTDDTGTFNIPVLDSDYIHIKHPQYDGILITASNTEPSLQLTANGLLFTNSKSTLGTFYTFGLVLVVLATIAYLIYTAYKNFK